MKQKLLALCMATLMLLGLLAGCGNGQPSASPQNSAEQSAAPSNSGETVSFTDSAGRVVEIPKNIERIAPTGAMAQIVLFAVAPDKMVGLATKWPSSSVALFDEKYTSLPVFGQFYGTSDLNMEALAAAKPQVIIDIGEKKGSIVEDMNSIQEQLGIPTIFVEASLSTMDACYKTLGELLGQEEAGNTLSAYCKEIYDNTVNTMEKIGESNRVSLVYCLGDTGTSVLAEGSFQSEALNMLANNVAVVNDPSSKGTGNEVSLEQLYLWDPEVLLFAPNSIFSTVKDDANWQTLKAVKNKKVYEVPGNPYNWIANPPSVNRYMGLIWLAKLLYPDQFDYDLYEETARYYNLFYHCDLTQEQFNELTANAK
ncbi:MAG: ABC transporter substrate-binding protein [Oscillospiraceae bacterium]|jgi:iron complex transport system substrate-binding protein|nr:ABC transporter substrate-binding protein [Oscillospiraceae bacterium]